MTLYAKVLLLVLIPVALFLAVDMIKVQEVTQEYEQAVKENYATQAKAVEANILALIKQLDTAKAVLSKSTQVSNAIASADNEVLFDLSNDFIGSVDSIIFADMEGIVLSRSPEEFKFGDSIAESDYFQAALQHGAFRGISRVDGAVSFVIAGLVRKYDDVPVGLVCVSSKINEGMLQSLVEGENIVLRFTHADFTASSSQEAAAIVHSVELPALFQGNTDVPCRLAILFTRNQNLMQLISLKRVIYSSTIASALVLLGLLLFFLHRQLKPYSALVNLILSYADATITPDTLRRKLAALKSHSGSEMSRIAGALVRMLDVIEDNFQRIELYNAELTNTVAKLEKSLQEVKTLSGLLPICTHCKKIRDDKGYWNQLEAYIRAHSKAEFSHSICPECAKKYYPDFDIYKD
ncbi:hypothetical protein [Desulfoferrobacter suflitae]|uniref:hypothetical protein n=1 Tax=Desulfoferrobacter suflitae TaxID=2865782 RepID=UPI00216444B4|nr:hypothetical protein [Desulfoferrobacter suflitae]MCK8603838.1 hypothetical protein [Desulfoferrobacter suflitae]